MSLIATAVSSGLGALSALPAQVSDPAASAPADLDAKAQLVLGIVKWASLMAVLGVLLGMGAIAFAADRGHGAGVSPEMKSKGMTAVIALVVVASAASIVNFVMG